MTLPQNFSAVARGRFLLKHFKFGEVAVGAFAANCQFRDGLDI
jgi:hypothetical protein